MSKIPKVQCHEGNQVVLDDFVLLEAAMSIECAQRVQHITRIDDQEDKTRLPLCPSVHTHWCMKSSMYLPK